MPSSVNLDNVRDKDKRDLMINFIYKTVVNQAAKEVWNDFKVQNSCLSYIEELEKSVLFYYSNHCKIFMYYITINRFQYDL